MEGCSAVPEASIAEGRAAGGERGGPRREDSRFTWTKHLGQPRPRLTAGSARRRRWRLAPCQAAPPRPGWPAWPHAWPWASRKCSTSSAAMQPACGSGGSGGGGGGSAVSGRVGTADPCAAQARCQGMTDAPAGRHTRSPARPAVLSPEPAAVTACRYFLSCTSPAANTPAVRYHGGSSGGGLGAAGAPAAGVHPGERSSSRQQGALLHTPGRPCGRLPPHPARRWRWSRGRSGCTCPHPAPPGVQDCTGLG